MKQAISRLTVGCIDYAGTFPPAELPFTEAFAQWRDINLDERRHWLNRWALSVPDLALLSEFRGPIAAIGRSGDWAEARETDARDLNAFQRANPDAEISTYEVRLPRRDYLATALAELQGFGEADVFLEVPGAEFDPDVAAAIADYEGVGLKIRTGGPGMATAAQLASALFEALAFEIPFKATAGLHQALSHAHGFGFLNAMAAPALAIAGELTVRELETLLADSDPANWRADDGSISWRGFSAGIEDIEEGRAALESFGSCSVDEPMASLRELEL